MKKVTPIEFEDKNRVLSDVSLQNETGWVKMSNGDYLVAMTCYMPNVTAEMLDWWFWWHPQASERYRNWFPGEHYSISYSSKNKEYFNVAVQPPFANNRQMPIERVGKIIMPLAIDFVTPEEFGFSSELIKSVNVSTIICGHVSAYWGVIPNTEMSHIAFQKDGGILLVSRFWLGKRLRNKILRALFLSENSAKGMALHCHDEYRNLAKILPNLYAKYEKKR